MLQLHKTQLNLLYKVQHFGIKLLKCWNKFTTTCTVDLIEKIVQYAASGQELHKVPLSCSVVLNRCNNDWQTYIKCPFVVWIAVMLCWL